VSANTRAVEELTNLYRSGSSSTRLNEGLIGLMLCQQGVGDHGEALRHTGAAASADARHRHTAQRQDPRPLSQRARACSIRPVGGATDESAHVGRGDAAMRLLDEETNMTSLIGCERALSGRQLRGDRLLVGDQEPQLGSHLVTPRRGYLHHGTTSVLARSFITRFAYGLRRGPVGKFLSTHYRAADGESG